MSISSSNYSVDLSLSSFSINASKSSSFSGAYCNDSDDSSSIDGSDTPCSSLLGSVDTNAFKRANLQSRDSTNNNKYREDLSSCVPSIAHEESSSFNKRKEKSKLKKQRKSSSSLFASNIEEITNTSNSSEHSFSLSRSSNASLSLPSPITYYSMETTRASLPEASAPQLQPSNPSEDLESLSKMKATQWTVEKEKLTSEAESQNSITLVSQENKNLIGSNIDLPTPRTDTQNLRGDSSEHGTIPPPLILSMQVMRSPQNIGDPSCVSPSLPQSDKELAAELPSTSSFHADEGRAIDPFLTLPEPPPRKQQCGPRAICSLNKTIKDINNSAVSFQSINNSILDETEIVWTAPNPGPSHISKIENSPTAPTPNATGQLSTASHQSVKSKKAFSLAVSGGTLPSNISVVAMGENNYHIEQDKYENVSKNREQREAKLYNRTEHDFSFIDQTRLSIVQNRPRTEELKTRAKVKSSRVTAELKNNIVRSAERSTVKNIRAYYINKIQEIEARHKKQLCDAKAHLYVSKKENNSLRREKESRREDTFASDKRPLVAYEKKSSKSTRGNLKDSFQQTDPFSEEHSSGPAGPKNQINDSAKLQELQNQIAKLASDNLLQEQLVQRLRDQLQQTNFELANARRVLSSNAGGIFGSPGNQQQLDPIMHQKLLKSLEVSQVKSIQLQNQVDNLQFENDNLKLQLSSATCMTEGSHIITKYSNLSRKICELEQRAIRREEDIQAKISEIQRKTAAENQRLQLLHEEEMREKDEKLTVLRTKLECLIRNKAE